MVTTILMDGDFLNYDFELHKDAKQANRSEYDHGPYKEGSVRHRRMYTYPNPLNYKLSLFHSRHLLIVKQHDLSSITSKNIPYTDLIIRTDQYENSFRYVAIDANSTTTQPLALDELPVRQDIFKMCKGRQPKSRTAFMPQLPE